jgi:hypothetical protein
VATNITTTNYVGPKSTYLAICAIMKRTLNTTLKRAIQNTVLGNVGLI